MDSNIIQDYQNIPVPNRTNDDFDTLLRTLEIVWGHKVYQDGLLEESQLANRELYDLSISMAEGLVLQDEGSKTTMIKYKDRFKQQRDSVISSLKVNQNDIVFRQNQLRQILMYYLDKDSIYFTADTVIENTFNDKHIFTFGEVISTYDDDVEVIVVNEGSKTIEFITYEMIGKEDKYIIPKLGLKTLFQSKVEEKKFVVTKHQVDSLYSQYATIFERLT